MPYTGAQQRAIAAQMKRDGKTPAQISAFFKRHNKPKAKKRAHR